MDDEAEELMKGVCGVAFAGTCYLLKIYLCASTESVSCCGDCTLRLKYKLMRRLKFPVEYSSPNHFHGCNGIEHGSRRARAKRDGRCDWSKSSSRVRRQRQTAVLGSYTKRDFKVTKALISFA